MPSRSRAPRWPVTLLVIALAAGCAEQPTAPRPGVAGSPRLAMSGSDPITIPNSRRYSDRGHQPATGRAGSAVLTAQALVGRSGQARIFTGSAHAHAPWWPAGRLERVQIKGFAPDGQPLFTRNYGTDTSEAIFEAAGLTPGATVQIQAVVSGVDPNRASVVTVTDVVRRLPDLAVANLNLPVRAAVNSAPIIRATVRELNGEVGGVADCVLDVNGSEVDRIHSMWVDAGGVVTCQFFHTFRSLGSHDVRVRLEPRWVGDWDTDNDAAGGTIRIDPATSSFYFDASFVDYTTDAHQRSAWRSGATDGSYGYEHEDESSFTGRTQEAWMNAWMGHAVRFPLDRIEPRQYTSDGPVQGFVLQNVPADFSWSFGGMTQSCIRRSFIPEIGGRGWLEICSVESEANEWEPAWGYTYATYYRNAGDVTYHSRGLSRFWDRDSGYEDVYSWNHSISDIYGRFASYGSEYFFFLSIVDRGALYRVNPVVWLGTEEFEWSNPWQCWSWADEWYRSEGCQESRGTQRIVSGSIFGEPWSP